MRTVMRIRASLLAGAAIIVPLVVTYLVLKFLFQSLDAILQPVFVPLLHRRIPGLGLIALLVVVYLAGLFARLVAGRWAAALADRLMARVPLAGPIYSATRRLVEALSAGGRVAFRRPVAIEYPRPGIWAIGFVTGRVTAGCEGRSCLSVFLPTPPNPASGLLLVVPEDSVVHLRISVEEAVKFVFSGGVVTPDAPLW